MLEKLGLPPKPAARGSSWVVDASHCQACATPFTLFNRKHHCRRCGGLFCGLCTQKRLVLRGQGDSPVRVCEACKKLEDAARFEARYARKAKIQKVEDLFDGEWNGKEEEPTSSSDQAHTNDKDLHVSMRDSIDSKEPLSKELVSPGVLRQQAQEEKNNYALLKREGKNAEALKAFKRGKELERQADALALSIRKSARMAATTSQASAPTDVQSTILSENNEVKPIVAAEEKGGKRPSRIFNDPKVKKAPLDEKDEFTEALKELGWSEAEISKSETREKSVQHPSSVLQSIKEMEVPADVTSKSPAHGSIDGGSMQMEILGHKRRALALKREGKLAEAKEELKKAKLLERQLEELEAADSEEEPDAELAALMKSLEKTENMKLKGSSVSSSIPTQEIHLDVWTNIADGIDDDNSNELVTEDDMNDPDMISALRSMGWMEEASALESFSAPADLKTKASADELMLKDVTEENMHDPQMLAMLRALEPDQEPIMPQIRSAASAVNPRQVSALQQEILHLKKAALSLKREGKADQAKEELRQAKLLEQKLSKIQAEHSAKERFQHFSVDDVKLEPSHRGQTGELGFDEADEFVEVSDRDMHDPELMTILKGMGWQEEDMLQEQSVSEMEDISPERFNVSQPTSARLPPRGQALPHLNKSELQKSLLGRKRKALMLRREGKFDEAEEELKAADKLDRQLEQLQALQEKEKVESISTHSTVPRFGSSNSTDLETEEDDVTVEDLNDPSMVAALVEMGWKDVGENETVQSSVYLELKHHHKPTESQANEPIPRLGIDSSRRDAIKLSEDSRLREQSQFSHNPQRGPEQVSRRHKFEPKEELHDEGKYVDIGGLHKGIDSSSNQRRPLDVLSDNSSKHRPDDEVQGASVSESSSITFEGLNAVQEISARKGSPLLQSVTLTEAGNKVGIPSSKSLQSSFSVVHPAGLFKEATLSSSNPTGGADIISTSSASTDSLQQEILAYKRRALAYKREGKQADAKKELAHAKLLEKQLDSQRAPSTGHQPIGIIKNGGSGVSAIQITHEETNIGAPFAKVAQEGNQPLKTSTENKSAEYGTTAQQHAKKGRDRMKLQRESLAHKRKALALRREGKIEEADSEFQLAKSLEQKMEELEDVDPGSAFKHGNQSSLQRHQDNDLDIVDDVFDPQLLSALKGLGWKEADILGNPENKLAKGAAENSQGSIETPPTKKTGSIPGSSHGITQLPGDKNKRELEQKIKAFKLQAVELKRAGKQGDALNALREAKRLEKILLSFSSP